MTALEKEVVENIRCELDKLTPSSFKNTHQSKTVFGQGYTGTWWDSVKTKVYERQIEYEALEEKQLEKRSRYRKQYKALVIPQIKEWVRKNVIVGDRIFVKGARDGIGFREVMETNNTEVLVCRKLIADRKARQKGIPFSKPYMRKHPECFIWVGDNYITNHMYDKVVAIMQNGRRIPIAELLN